MRYIITLAPMYRKKMGSELKKQHWEEFGHLNKVLAPNINQTHKKSVIFFMYEVEKSEDEKVEKRW